MNGNWRIDRVFSDLWPFGKDWGSLYRRFMSNRDDHHFHRRMEVDVSDDGLVVIKRLDFDGDRDFDLISTSTTTILANGDRQVVVEFRDGANTLLRKISTTTSDGGNSKMTTIDLDGDGQIDRQLSFAKADDGSIVRTSSVYSEDGALENQERYTFSPSAKTITHEWDRNGDGQFEGSSVQVVKHGYRPLKLWSSQGSNHLEDLPFGLLHGTDGWLRNSWINGDGGPSGNAYRPLEDHTGNAGPDVALLTSGIEADQFEFSTNTRKHDDGNDAHHQTDLIEAVWAAEHAFSHPTGDWARGLEFMIADSSHLPRQHEATPISLASDDFLFV